MQNTTQGKMGIFSAKGKKCQSIHPSIHKCVTQDNAGFGQIHISVSFCSETSQHLFYLLEHQHTDAMTPIVF